MHFDHLHAPCDALHVECGCGATAHFTRFCYTLGVCVCVCVSQLMTLRVRCRRSSIVREERTGVMKDLPLLKDTATTKREALFKQKLSLCCVS